MSERTSQSDDPISMIGQYAGFVSRLLAFILDLFLASVILLGTTWFISTTIKLFEVKSLLYSISANFPVLKILVDLIFSPVTASILSLALILFYYVFFVSLAGQTPGKAILGLRVVPLRGGKVSLGRAFFRYLGYYLSALPLGLGFFWVLIDDRRMAFHDKLVKTCVIYVWDARPDETFLRHAIDEITARREALRALITKRKRLEQVLQEPDPNTPIDQGQQNSA